MKTPYLDINNFKLSSCNEKESNTITLNKNLINLRKKSSGSVLQHIIELHSHNLESKCDNLPKDFFLNSAKVSKKSLECKMFFNHSTK